jgi:hypothetical protein
MESSGDDHGTDNVPFHGLESEDINPTARLGDQDRELRPQEPTESTAGDPVHPEPREQPEHPEEAVAAKLYRAKEGRIV